MKMMHTMRKTLKILPLGLALVAVALVSGCVTGDRATRDASLEWRVQSLEKSFLDFQESHRQLQDDVASEGKTLAERIQALEQRLAEMETSQGGWTPGEPAPSGQPAEAAPQPAEETMMALDATAAAVPPVKAGPESPEDKPWDEVPGQPAPTSAQAASTSGAASAAQVYASKADAGTLYALSLDMLSAGKPAEARALLEQFLGRYPGSSLVPNAMYWLGETWYSEKNYPKAILAFKDVTAKFPAHSKAAAALLKTGMSYMNMKDVDNAVFYLRTLVDEHPDSDPARQARQLLTELAR